MALGFFTRRKTTIGIAVVILAVVLILFERWVFSQDFQTRGKFMRAQVVVIIQLGLSVLSSFVWRNIANVFDWKKQETVYDKKSRFTFIWRCFVITYIFLAHSSYICNILLVSSTDPYLYAMVSYFTLGFHVQVATGIALFKLLNFVLHKCTKIYFARKTIVLMVIIYAVSVSLYGFYNAQRPPTIKRVTIPVKDLPKSLDGLTITHLSDIHMGPTNGRSKLLHLINMVNDIDSDMVVIVGDLVDGPVMELKESVSNLHNIKSKYGVYFVTGNHEYYTMDVDNWVQLLESAGVHVLHNSHAKIPRNASPSDQICLIGTDDLEASRISYEDHGYDIDKAVEGCSVEQPSILLAHQPKAAKLALQSQHRIDLVLSGHTHGGQMFPITIGAYFANPYYAGLYRYGDSSHIYVSMGTFYWGFPLRILTTKEIAVITLLTK